MGESGAQGTGAQGTGAQGIVVQGSAPGVAARAAAVALLGAILGEGRTLDEAAETPGGPLASLPAAERARAARLAATVLRQLSRADAVLAPHLRRMPPRTVRNTLRLAVTEIGALATPPHAAVAAAVEVLRTGRRTQPFAALANAVLRKVAAEPPDMAAMAVPRLPGWLRQMLAAAWGRAALEAIEAVQAGEPPLDLTPRPGARPEIPGAEALPTGSLRLVRAGQVSALPGHAEGLWWVQDAAAALAVPLLAPQPGERIADLCAAPGGKTLQLAAAGAEVTAVDISRPRLRRLADNLIRCNLSAELVAADALHWQPRLPVAAVLLDAPCTATGTIRRHPDLPHLRRPADLPGLCALQATLIDRALAMLPPGGRMVYCTCSLLPAEGEDQTAAALARHPGLAVEPGEVAGLDPRWRAPDGAIRTRPDHWAERGGIDGFYMVRLRKPG